MPGGWWNLRTDGVSERIILAAARKTPPREPLTTYGLTQLVQAGFSDGFLIDLLSIQPVRISTDAANIVQLKQAGLSERVLAAIVTKGSGRELAKGTQIVVRLIDGIDSEKSKEGDTFRASLDDPLMDGNDVLAPKGADATVKLVSSQESGKLTGKAELTVALVAVNGRWRAGGGQHVLRVAGERLARRAYRQGGGRDGGGGSDHRRHRRRRLGRRHRERAPGPRPARVLRSS